MMEFSSPPGGGKGFRACEYEPSVISRLPEMPESSQDTLLTTCR
jgi:hypothetical protein